MIDYLLSFADEATARADAVVGAYWRPPRDNIAGAWRGDCVIPGARVWNPAQDTVTQQSEGGLSFNVTTHVYQAGWWLVIALPARDAALDAHAALQLVADRDAANAGAAPAQVILYSKLPLQQVVGLMLAPVFAGSSYPFGAAQ